MRLFWTPRARRDLRELVAYIAEDSVQTAEAVLQRILNSAAGLTDMPHAGRAGRISGTRERVVQRTPFILVYRVDPEQVHVLRVLRGARKWPDSFSS